MSDLLHIIAVIIKMHVATVLDDCQEKGIHKGLLLQKDWMGWVAGL